MTEYQQQLAWGLAVLVALCTIIPAGIKVWRMVKHAAMEWLRTELVEPVSEVQESVAEVRKQVTENHHSNPEPTLPDRLSDVRQDLAELHEDVRISNRFMEAHTNWSQEWTERIEKTVDELVVDGARSAKLHADHARRLAALEAVWAPTPPRTDHDRPAS